MIGRSELLPERLRKVVDDSAALSHEAGAVDVTIALACSGREELLMAIRAIRTFQLRSRRFGR